MDWKLLKANFSNKLSKENIYGRIHKKSYLKKEEEYKLDFGIKLKLKMYALPKTHFTQNQICSLFYESTSHMKTLCMITLIVVYRL